jgi:hypothetical protein
LLPQFCFSFALDSNAANDLKQVSANLKKPQNLILTMLSQYYCKP